MSEALNNYKEKLPDPDMPDLLEIVQCEMEDLFHTVRCEHETKSRVGYHCREVGKDEDDIKQLEALAKDMVKTFKDAGLYNSRGRMRAEFYRFDGDTTLLLKQTATYEEPPIYDPDDIPF